MSIVKCDECGKDVSTKAKLCPSCGSPVKQKTSLLTWLVAGFFGLAIIIGISNHQPTPPPAPLSEAEQKAKELRNTRQSAAIAAAGIMKRGMKNPESFDLKELVVKEDGTGCFTYRAINSFNATLQSSAVLVPGAKVQLLLESTDGNRFVTAWNARCTKAGGEDITSLAKRLMDR